MGRVEMRARTSAWTSRQAAVSIPRNDRRVSSCNLHLANIYSGAEFALKMVFAPRGELPEMLMIVLETEGADPRSRVGSNMTADEVQAYPVCLPWRVVVAYLVVGLLLLYLA